MIYIKTKRVKYEDYANWRTNSDIYFNFELGFVTMEEACDQIGIDGMKEHYESEYDYNDAYYELNNVLFENGYYNDYNMFTGYCDWQVENIDANTVLIIVALEG